MTMLAKIARAHLRFGFWGLFAFASLGFLLESLHALKLGFYLDVGNETRRLMWRLAHAHGALLSLVNVVFSLCLRTGQLEPAQPGLVSKLLVASTLLLPGGFFLGGVLIHAGDPGVMVLLVPLGAVLFLSAVFFMARAGR